MTDSLLAIESLLGRGFFPKEIVPSFNTKDLSKNLSEVLSKIELGNSKLQTSKCFIHSFPKTKNIRRGLGIPNPKHQILLSKAVTDNWEDIYNFSKQSKISKSYINIDENNQYNRAAYPGLNFNIQLERAIQASGFSYCLYSDISRYYSTIYTHSIPWAIHTKEVAKADRKDSLYGNLIDKYVRNTQDGQTLGIPIGTDTSYIISEIIGTAMDILLYENLKDNLRGFRYIDDYYLYFSSFSEAEYALRKLHYILKEFELEPNPTKTSIVELPDPIENKWFSDLRIFNISNDIRNQHDELLIYFSKVFEYSKNFPNDNVVKYAVSKIKKIFIHQDNWELYQSLLLQSLVAEPGIIPIVAEIFMGYLSYDFELNIEKISEAINKFLIYHAELGHGYEVSWGLWLCKNLEIKVSKTVINKVLTLEDSIVGIIVFDLIKNSSLVSSDDVDLTRWKMLMKSSELYSKNWLFAYEANFQGWSSSINDYVNSDNFFSILKNNNVGFYNPEENIDSSKVGVIGNDDIDEDSLSEEDQFSFDY